MTETQVAAQIEQALVQASTLPEGFKLAETEVGYIRFDFEGRDSGVCLGDAVTSVVADGYAFDGYDEEGFACWRKQ